MVEEEEFVEVQVFPAIYGEEEEWIMMSYERGGIRYITFATEESDGVWIHGPFPAHLTECERCLEGLAANLAEQGYILTHVPEQMIRVM